MTEAVKKPITVELYTIKQVADLCSVTSRTARRWIKEKAMPAPVRPGSNPHGALMRGAVRFRRKAIEKWIELGCPRSSEEEESTK